MGEEIKNILREGSMKSFIACVIVVAMVEEEYNEVTPKWRRK